jgi:hypothetical protein
MSLAGACGAWNSGLGSIAASRVVHCGARIERGDFDEAGHREAEASELTMIPVGASCRERVVAALDGAPVLGLEVTAYHARLSGAVERLLQA